MFACKDKRPSCWSVSRCQLPSTSFPPLWTDNLVGFMPLNLPIHILRTHLTNFVVYFSWILSLAVVQASWQISTRDQEGPQEPFGRQSCRASRRQARHTHQTTIDSQNWHQHCCQSDRTEKGPIGRHRSWRRPNRGLYFWKFDSIRNLQWL